MNIPFCFMGVREDTRSAVAGGRTLSVIFSYTPLCGRGLISEDLLFVAASGRGGIRYLRIAFSVNGFLRVANFGLQGPNVGTQRFFGLYCSGHLARTSFRFSASKAARVGVQILPDLVGGGLSTGVLNSCGVDRPGLCASGVTKSLDTYVKFIQSNNRNHFIPGAILRNSVQAGMGTTSQVVTACHGDHDRRRCSRVIFATGGMR